MTRITGKNAYIYLPGGERAEVTDFQITLTLANGVTLKDREIADDNIDIVVF